MELTISASPFELAGLRRAARDALGEVPTQVADEMLLALDEAATNAILHGSGGGYPVEVAVRVRIAVSASGRPTNGEPSATGNCAVLTPSTLLRRFSIRRTHEAHVMPVIARLQTTA